MIPSLYQIDFHDGTQAHRLLDFGEMLSADVVTQFTQAADRFSPIGSDWSESVAKGGASTSIVWGVIRQHASHEALRGYCMIQTADFPSGTTGTMRIAVEGGDSWLIHNATNLTSATSPRVPCEEFETVSFITGEGGQLAALPAPTRLPDQPAMDIRMVDDSTGLWCEAGFQTDFLLTGSAATGWTDPAEICSITLQASTNLLAWTVGGFVDCPGSPTDMGDGSWQYWSRAVVPAHWKYTMVDMTVSSDLYGKTLTAGLERSTAISLPGYPYAIPADAARLQADLRASGYPGSVVTSTAAALTATARNFTVNGTYPLPVYQSGTNVTNVTSLGVTIPLSYPYALPADQARLQTDLRAAGQAGAVVMLHADQWSVMIPNRLAVGTIRDFSLTVYPGDPFPVWNGFQVYQGLSTANIVSGSPGNTRSPAGAPLLESDKQFSRLKIVI